MLIYRKIRELLHMCADQFLVIIQNLNTSAKIDKFRLFRMEVITSRIGLKGD